MRKFSTFTLQYGTITLKNIGAKGAAIKFARSSESERSQALLSYDFKQS